MVEKDRQVIGCLALILVGVGAAILDIVIWAFAGFRWAALALFAEFVVFATLLFRLTLRDMSGWL